jgi:DNA end-binding protein Ku
MARAIWSGSISFGLVNVPVKVFTAVREHSVHFHQVDKATGSRIRYDKVSESTGKEVVAADIELGYELAKGKLVTVDPDQIDELRPRTTRTIDIADFVDLAQIDPVFYDRTYWLAPDGEVARRPYGLLVHAMNDRRQAGIGTVVMRNKQYLAAIRPRDGALAMSTMHFADEVLAKSDVGSLPARVTAPAPKELRLATQIIDSLSTHWDPQRYKDTFTDEVKQLIERQAEGEDNVLEEAPAPQAQVLDLVAALEASLQAAGKAKGSRSSRLRQLEKAAQKISDKVEAEADEAKVPKRPVPGGARSTTKETAPRTKKAAPRKSPARKSA